MLRIIKSFLTLLEVVYCTFQEAPFDLTLIVNTKIIASNTNLLMTQKKTN